MAVLRWMACFLVGAFFAVFAASILDGAQGRFDSGTIIGAVAFSLGSAACFFVSSDKPKARGASALCAAALLGLVAITAHQGATSYEKVISVTPGQLPSADVRSLQSGITSARNMSAAYGIVAAVVFVVGFGLLVLPLGRKSSVPK